MSLCKRNWWEPPECTYELTRILLLRGLGVIYFLAFLVVLRQWGPLLGSDGLLPAPRYLEQIRAAYDGSALAGFWNVPSVFWISHSDAFMQGLAWIGLALSFLLICGVANAVLMAALWFLYMSYIHAGQLFYGYGWEIMTLEAGFLAIFLCPLTTWRLSRADPPSRIILWFYRWMIFRVMFGAGLIKLRGDPCWRDLTCLIYHYETQPIPHVLSWWFHQCPPAFHKFGVLWNHFVELVVPWFVFGPPRWRRLGGLLIVSFQILLILSGNLSWLNWLTIVIAIPCFDDRALAWLGGAKRPWLGEAQRRRPAEPQVSGRSIGGSAGLSVEALAKTEGFALPRRIIIGIVTAILLYLSIHPVLNMISPRQIMNTSFDRLHLMNTYGAFGSVGKERYEIILEGTDGYPLDPEAEWREYEFKGKPGDVMRRPPFVAPYHLRLDWQMWFAAMSRYEREPWLVHFVCKLLQGNPAAVSLIRTNPFPDRPPRFIRAELYRYRFTSRRERKTTGAWWHRERVGVYLPPVSLENPSLQEFLRAYGWGT